MELGSGTQLTIDLVLQFHETEHGVPRMEISKSRNPPSPNSILKGVRDLEDPDGWLPNN